MELILQGVVSSRFNNKAYMMKFIFHWIGINLIFKKQYYRITTKLYRQAKKKFMVVWNLSCKALLEQNIEHSSCALVPLSSLPVNRIFDLSSSHIHHIFRLIPPDTGISAEEPALFLAMLSWSCYNDSVTQTMKLYTYLKLHTYSKFFVCFILVCITAHRQYGKKRGREGSPWHPNCAK